MKVKLPSLGVLGCTEVELQTPRYRHVRDLSQQSYHPDEIGYKFLELLLEDPSALDHMTYQDKDYLVAIAVASMHMNAMSLNATCRCGEPVKVVYDLSQQELFTLDEGIPQVVKKTCCGVEYEYHMLSASQEHELIKWALKKSERFDGEAAEKEYARNYEEGFIALTFGKPLTEEGLAAVASYEMLVYYSALLFREMSFHGVQAFKATECPACHRSLNLIVPFAKTLANWSSTDVVREFMGVASYIGGFQSFLDLTFAEMEQIRVDLPQE